MDNWVLQGVKNLVKQPQRESTVGPGQVKVKVSHVLLSTFDALCYTGDIHIGYPKTIGRFAIGIITEVGAECYGVEKDARVFFKSSKACNKCLPCKSGNRDDCENVQIAGKDYDGFLRDFVVCSYKDVAVIPDSVDDLHALCIEYVGLAENIFDKLNLSAGSNVAVIGAGFFGSILTQVALYHKLVPIVVDNYKQNVDRLKRSGVFYTFAADDNLEANVLDATSGKLCDAAIFTSSSKATLNLAAITLAKKKDLVLGGFSTNTFNIDSTPIVEKSLRLYAVTDGYGYDEAAINMLVHGAISLDPFEKQILTEFDAPALLLKRAENNATASAITVLKLIL